MVQLTFDNAPHYEVNGVTYVDETAFAELIGEVIADNAELLDRLGDD